MCLPQPAAYFYKTDGNLVVLRPLLPSQVCLRLGRERRGVGSAAVCTIFPGENRIKKMEVSIMKYSPHSLR